MVVSRTIRSISSFEIELLDLDGASFVLATALMSHFGAAGLGTIDEAIVYG
jgi:hypothetical protein